MVIVKTQRNSTQRKTTLKQLALELDIVVMSSCRHDLEVAEKFVVVGGEHVSTVLTPTLVALELF